MPQSDSRTQIIIACISVAGVIAAALIASRPKPPDPPPAPTPPVTAPAALVATTPQAPSAQLIQPAPAPSPQPVDVPQPVQPQQPAPPRLSNDPDAVVILSATPANGTPLAAGQLTNFNVTLLYRLTSLQQATLNVEINQVDHNSTCSADGNIPIAQQVAMVAGEHKASVKLSYRVGVSKQVTSDGSIGYGASIWSDFVQRKMFKNFGALSGYCYPFK